MKLLRCNNGHFYDGDKFTECPHCNEKALDSIKTFLDVKENNESSFDMEDDYCDDYSGKCGNCHSILEDDDKYCRYCGTPRGEGAFLPYKNIVMCIYAPPIETKHKCKKCGYSWVTNALGRDRAEYCPRCRGKLKSKYKDGL